MSKEMWMIAYEKLEADLGREPTDSEVDEKCADMIADETDKQYENYRQEIENERINHEDNLKEDRRLEVGRGPLRVT